MWEYFSYVSGELFISSVEFMLGIKLQLYKVVNTFPLLENVLGILYPGIWSTVQRCKQKQYFNHYSVTKTDTDQWNVIPTSIFNTCTV